MLTIDDCNTILEKYSSGFFYELDIQEIDLTIGAHYTHDFIDIEIINYGQTPTLKMHIYNSLWHGAYYCVKHNGELSNESIEKVTTDSDTYFQLQLGDSDDFIVKFYLTPKPAGIYGTFKLSNCRWLFVPMSPLQIPVVNGEFDNKMYIGIFGQPATYLINDQVVQLQHDSKGYYLEFPSATDCFIGVKDQDQVPIQLYWVTFYKSKNIPTLSIPTLYKGTSQQVQLYNEDTEEYITEFQAHYQGRKLKDNIVTLDYDVDDIVDIVIDILDPKYPPSRVKLKAPTTLYTATSQAEVETAISNGITTLKIIKNNNSAVSLNEITLDNITIINSKLTIYESTLTNTRIINTRYTDKNHNTFNNVEIKNTTIEGQIEISFKPSSYNNCQILDSTLESIEMHYDGTIKDTIITKSLIISDTNVELIGNTFTGMLSDGMGLYTKPYFPAQLYLTGEYTVKNNSFTLSGTWTEPAFNMCVIKSIESFNPSVFIAENTFQLNIVYDTEPTNTFYYNIVDDDKIYARRLS